MIGRIRTGVPGYCKGTDALPAPISAPVRRVEDASPADMLALATIESEES